MESSEALRKRLVFLARRRSMAEMEHLLGRLLDERMAQWGDGECLRVLSLLQYPDLDLLDWISGRREPETGVDREVLAWIAALAYTAGPGEAPPWRVQGRALGLCRCR